MAIPQPLEKSSLTAAKEAVGNENVIRYTQPIFGNKNFSLIVNQIPSCYVFIGNRIDALSEFVHPPLYVFND